MDVQKEREAFKSWAYSKKWNISRVRDHYVDDFVNGAWHGWQAKAQAVPENKKFNLDEFLEMEQKLKSKGGIIKADLDRFIAYAEMVLEKAKALKEPK